MTDDILRCDYCKAPAKLVDSSVFYGRSYGLMWVCSKYPKCDAYVGCHQDTDKPLGRLANPQLRAAKRRAHAVFDPLWKEAPRMYRLPRDPIGKQYNLSRSHRRKEIGRIRSRARHRAYAWLAEQMGIRGEDCHIGHFTLEQCEAVVSLCQRVSPEIIRAWAKARETEETT